MGGSLFYIENAHGKAQELAKIMAQIRLECDQAFRGLVTAFFHTVAMSTPQWSGNAASNWNVSTAGADLSTISTFKEISAATPWLPRYQMGNTLAVYPAARRAEGPLKGVTVHDTVHISNASENLEGKMYIEYLETNPNGFLRPENDGGQMVAKTIIKFRGLRVTPNVFVALQALKPGQLTNPGVGV